MVSGLPLPLPVTGAAAAAENMGAAASVPGGIGVTRCIAALLLLLLLLLQAVPAPGHRVAGEVVATAAAAAGWCPSARMHLHP